MIRYLIFITTSFVVSHGFSQSKKEQIELLNKKMDSLNTVLNIERLKYKESTIAFIEKINHFNQKINSIIEDNLFTKNELNNKNLECSELGFKLNECTKLNQTLINKLDEKSNNLHRLVLLKNVYQIDSWVDSASVIIFVNGNNCNVFDLSTHYTIEEIARLEYEINQIPINATAAFYLGYTSGEGILYSTIEHNFLCIYKGYRGESEMLQGKSYGIELVMRYEIR